MNKTFTEREVVRVAFFNKVTHEDMSVDEIKTMIDTFMIEEWGAQLSALNTLVTFDVEYLYLRYGKEVVAYFSAKYAEAYS